MIHEHKNGSSSHLKHNKGIFSCTFNYYGYDGVGYNGYKASSIFNYTIVSVAFFPGIYKLTQSNQFILPTQKELYEKPD